jgi:hypothetical protein
MLMLSFRLFLCNVSMRGGITLHTNAWPHQLLRGDEQNTLKQRCEFQLQTTSNYRGACGASANNLMCPEQRAAKAEEMAMPARPRRHGLVLAPRLWAERVTLITEAERVTWITEAERVTWITDWMKQNHH